MSVATVRMSVATVRILIGAVSLRSVVSQISIATVRFLLPAGGEREYAAAGESLDTYAVGLLGSILCSS